MSTAMKRLAVALLVVIACGTATSGADYTATSHNPQTFTAAADFGVQVSLAAPNARLRGTVPLEATPTVTAGNTIASVTIQRAPTGTGAWSDICVDHAGPSYTCSFDTTGVANGEYDLRARATNQNGYSATSAVVAARLVDNASPTVTMEDPGAWFRGTKTLRSTVSDTGGSGLATVRYEYKPAASGTWTTACTASAADWSCPFPTASLADGNNYDFRAVATDGAGNVTESATWGNRKPDNTSPSGSLTDPLTNRRGTVTLTLSGSDGQSGVASVAVQYASAGGSTWSTACVDTTTPFDSCDWVTPPLDGVFDLRAVVTDVAGNTFTTATIASRRIDNGLPTVTLPDPGSPLSGTVTLNSNASDGGSGVRDVATQYSLAGANSWTNACFRTAPSYACSANTAGVPDGLYDLRAAATDNAGNVAYATVPNRRIDNFTPSASDVQTADASGTHDGIIETGDTITLTYSEPIDPASIIAGWSGATTNITLRFDHHNQGDRVLFWNAANSTTLPLATSPGVNFNGDYVPSTNAVYAGTLTRSASGNVFTVTVGSGSGAHTTRLATADTMTWFPSNGAKDFANKAVSTPQRAESGSPVDLEF